MAGICTHRTRHISCDHTTAYLMCTKNQHARSHDTLHATLQGPCMAMRAAGFEQIVSDLQITLLEQDEAAMIVKKKVNLCVVGRKGKGV